jgi:hypothetical protein
MSHAWNSWCARRVKFQACDIALIIIAGANSWCASSYFIVYIDILRYIDIYIIIYIYMYVCMYMYITRTHTHTHTHRVDYWSDAKLDREKRERQEKEEKRLRHLTSRALSMWRNRVSAQFFSIFF